MKRRYIVLRVISFLFKLGAILMLLAALSSLGMGLALLLSVARSDGGIVQWLQAGGAFFLFAWSILQFMVLYAVGEVLNILMAIEENTRATSMRLVRLLTLLTEEESPSTPALESSESTQPEVG